MHFSLIEEIQKNRERINLKLLKEIVEKEKALDNTQYQLRECQREIAVTKIIQSTSKPVEPGMVQEILKKLQSGDDDREQKAEREMSRVNHVYTVPCKEPFLKEGF